MYDFQIVEKRVETCIRVKRSGADYYFLITKLSKRVLEARSSHANSYPFHGTGVSTKAAIANWFAQYDGQSTKQAA
jgi:hypothetical protein